MQRTICVALYTLFEVRRHKILKSLTLEFFVLTFIYFRSKDSQVQSSISIVLLPESSQMKFLFYLYFILWSHLPLILLECLMWKEIYYSIPDPSRDWMIFSRHCSLGNGRVFYFCSFPSTVTLMNSSFTFWNFDLFKSGILSTICYAFVSLSFEVYQCRLGILKAFKFTKYPRL